MINQLETCEVFTDTGGGCNLLSMIKTWPLASRSADKENSTLLTELNIGCGINLTAQCTPLSCAQKCVTRDLVQKKSDPKA